MKPTIAAAMSQPMCATTNSTRLRDPRMRRAQQDDATPKSGADEERRDRVGCRRLSRWRRDRPKPRDRDHSENGERKRREDLVAKTIHDVEAWGSSRPFRGPFRRSRALAGSLRLP